MAMYEGAEIARIYIIPNHSEVYINASSIFQMPFIILCKNLFVVILLNHVARHGHLIWLPRVFLTPSWLL